MADPTASNMAATVVADLNHVASIEGTDAAISTAVALLTGSAGYISETAGPQRVVHILQEAMQTFQAEADKDAREPRH